jgi:hypothetical protein
VSTAAETPARRVSLPDRLLVALPLASLYVWISVVYCVEAWKRATPWLFTDELELTQLSRSFAATGHAARRGEPHSLRSLYTVFTAFFWKIDDVAAAFAAIKYADTLAMTAVVFPTYFLARMVVGRTPALFAAAGAAAVPALAYSSWIVEETLAYPFAALCFLLMAKALVVRSRGWVAAAVVASAVAPTVRGELSVIPVTFALALAAMWWSSERTTSRRSKWSIGDWVGWLTICIGLVVFVSGFLSHHVVAWYDVTTYYKHRLFIFGGWAAGALAIGMGVVPMIFGLAALWRLPGERRTLELRAFRCVAVAALASFWMYTAVKAAYLSLVFASRVEERNLIYVAPLLFVGMAIVLERRRVNLWALSAAAAYSIYVALGVPLSIGGGLYSDALGLAIFQQGNRYFLLSTGDARLITVAVVLLGIALVLVAMRTASTGVARTAALVVGVGVLTWSFTAEIAAAVGGVTVSRDIRPALGEPFTWVDDATHLKPTLYLAQGVTDQNPEWLLEFWNRSITTVSSLDGSAGGPGPAGAPNITPRGQVYWTASPADPGKRFAYAVEDWPCIDFAGARVATHFYRGGTALPRQWRLIRLTQPNRLRADCVGIYADGWSGPNDSTYFRFLARRRGWLRITLSRGGFPATKVDVETAAIATQERTPVIGRVLTHRSATVPSNKQVTLWIRTPARPLAVHVVVQRKIVPSQIDPTSHDVRTLGAQIGYQWFLTKRE